MMRFVAAIALLFAFAVGSWGCAAKPGAGVSGRVILGDSAGYPIGTVLVVRVADISANPARQLGEQRQSLDPGWEAPGTHPPRDFAVDYDPSEVAASDDYVVWAEARRDGQVVEASAPVPVLTGGNAASGVELGLVPAETLATAPPLP